MSLLAAADRPLLVAVLDRLLPAVDQLPAAGAMGILDDIERMVTPSDRFGAAVTNFASLIGGEAGADFTALPGDAQDALIAALEAAHPTVFGLLLEIVYIGYYSRPEVHARIGWRTGPLQPSGFELPPFDDSVLDTVRRRAPLWRRTPD